MNYEYFKYINNEASDILSFPNVYLLVFKIFCLLKKPCNFTFYFQFISLLIKTYIEVGHKKKNWKKAFVKRSLWFLLLGMNQHCSIYFKYKIASWIYFYSFMYYAKVYCRVCGWAKEIRRKKNNLLYVANIWFYKSCI